VQAKVVHDVPQLVYNTRYYGECSVDMHLIMHASTHSSSCPRCAPVSSQPQ
jgi:hypothetical protein